MKSLTTISLLCFSTLTVTHTQHHHYTTEPTITYEHQKKPKKNWCEKIQRRCHLFKRIDYIISWIASKQRTWYIKEAFFNAINIMLHDTQYPLSKPTTIMLNNVIKEQSLSPFLTMWHECGIYKYIDLSETDIIDELIITIYTFFHTLMHEQTSLLTKNTRNIDIEPIIATIEYQYDTIYWPPINQIHNTLNQFKPLHTLLTPLLKPMMQEPSFDYHYTRINTRIIYYQKRITPLLKTLNTLINMSNEHHIKNMIEQLINIVNRHHLSFKNELIVHHITLLTSSPSCIPLLHLQHQVMCGRGSHNIQFLKEYTVLIYILIIAGLKKDIDTLEQIKLPSLLLPSLNDIINTFPLEQLLDVIELLSEEFPKLIEEYEFNKPFEWKVWCKKYCLKAPISFIKLSLKTLIKLKPLFIPPINN